MEELDSIFILFDIAAYLLVFILGYNILSSTHHFRRNTGWRKIISFCWITSLLILFFTLRYLASYDVVDSIYYISGYMSFGLLWIAFVISFFGLVSDIRFTDDVRERNNSSAAIVCGAFMIATAISFSGANVGNGPGWEVVLFSASLSTTFLLAGTFLLNFYGNYFEKVTVERDHNAAFRFSAALIGMSIILGKSVAGDWVSAAATISDFFHGIWLLPYFLILTVLLENKIWSRQNFKSARYSILYSILIIGLPLFYIVYNW